MEERLPRRSPAADRNSVESIHYVDGRRRDDNGWLRWLFLVSALYGIGAGSPA